MSSYSEKHIAGCHNKEDELRIIIFGPNIITEELGKSLNRSETPF